MLNNPNFWLAGGALLGILAACWSRLRVLLSRLVSLLVVRVRVEDDVGRALAAYCWRHLKRSPYGERCYSGITTYVQPVERYQVVGYESVGADPIVFWEGWRPLVMTYQYTNQNDRLPSGSLVATFLRGTFNLDSLLIKALEEFNQLRHAGTNGSRFKVEKLFGMARKTRYAQLGDQNKDSRGATRSVEDDEKSPDRRYLKWQVHELGASKGDADPFGALAFPAHVQEVLEHVHHWLASERWYKDKHIPWRLGVLYYGPPGTGKTSAAVALARSMDLPVFAFDLTSFDNQEFTHAWNRMLNEVPCVALLEDIDAVFERRENRLEEESGGLTFDCLLNCISGARDASGVLTIVTTNRVECLDEALGKPCGNHGMSTRPGRIDLAVELPRLNEDCRRKIAARILADCPEEIDRLVSEGAGDSGAQFQSRCEKVALAHYWREKK